jgi:hypothetical protein
MPKAVKRKIGSGVVAPEKQASARIIVGAERAPRITPQTEQKQSPLGDLFDSLGEFADGPFAKALRGRHLEGIEIQAQKDVAQGKTLDEIEDPNFIYEHYFRGAAGQRRGVDAMGALAAEFSENENNPDYDPTAAAHKALAAVEDMDDDTAANFLSVVKTRLPDMLDKESDRRIESARIEAIQVGRENVTVQNLANAKEDNYADVHARFADERADTKNLPGYDSKVHNLWETNEWMSYLKENGPTQAWLDAVQTPFNGEKGPSLWTNPTVGPKLRAAWETATRETATKQSLEQLRTAKRMIRAAQDMETLPQEDTVIAMEANGDLTTGQAGTILDNREKTILADQAELQDAGHLSAPSVTGATPEDLTEILTDAGKLEAATRRMVQEGEESGLEPPQARLETAEIMAQKHGTAVEWLNREYSSKVRAGDFESGAAYYETLRQENPMLAAKWGTASERTAVQFWQTMAANVDPGTAKELTNRGFENYDAGKQAILATVKDRTFDGILDVKKVSGDAAMRARIMERANFLVGTGQTAATATLEAIRLEKLETFRDENDTPMPSDANNPLWALDNVREYTREQFLKPWLERRTGDTGNLIERDDEFQAIVRPLRDGMALIETPEGIVLGVVPLSTWADQAHKFLRFEAEEEVRKSQVESDRKRAKPPIFLRRNRT